MKKFAKINAGAIQYVLVISVVIIIVLFAFISLVYTQKRIQLKSVLYKAAIEATYMGFNYLKTNSISYNTNTKISFTDYNFEQTVITKKPWGIFDIGIIRATLKKETFLKVALLGNKNKGGKALYLAENNQALVLVGNTNIKGDVILPKRGVKTGNIAGISYYGAKLIDGNIKKTANNLPKIQNLAYLKQLIKAPPTEAKEYISLEEKMQLNQSFTDNTLVYKTQRNLSLRDIQLRGNIVIISSADITVYPTAILEDVIIIAPTVTLETSVKGNFQVFASKSIHLKKGVQLQYPSSLVLLQEKAPETLNRNPKKINGIKIDNKAMVKGPVLFYSNDKKNGYGTQILIEENAQVIGEVYCTKNLELRGKVAGVVYTNNFIAKQAGSVYSNHLYNAVINSSNISEKYNGLFIDAENKQVAKWVE
ncbi:MAG: hypothetical protein HN487_09230 [Flavobacterium sp.]|nr:hypothetical protein [Flavobacterium sp.]